jgi:hypothetical protein
MYVIPSACDCGLAQMLRCPDAVSAADCAIAVGRPGHDRVLCCVVCGLRRCGLRRALLLALLLALVSPGCLAIAPSAMAKLLPQTRSSRQGQRPASAIGTLSVASAPLPVISASGNCYEANDECVRPKLNCVVVVVVVVVVAAVFLCLQRQLGFCSEVLVAASDRSFSLPSVLSPSRPAVLPGLWYSLALQHSFLPSVA